MHCEQAKPLLLDYLLEETSAGARAEIIHHLENCGACSREMDQLRQTLSLVVKGEVREEIPQRIRLVAEPVSRWSALWQSSARLSFATAGLLCVAVVLLALFQMTVSYGEGNLQVAFGAATTRTAGQQLAPVAVQPVTVSGTLDRAEVLRLIAETVAASEARQQQQTRDFVEVVSRQVEQQRLRDLSELAESLRYFQAAQTMMWKEQVQSQHLVSTWLQQAGMPAERP
ncbi:MAG: zf-HC2 domain-containing protein [Acidobacteria bacterium]|nr:zf-HC2 domain-containing protein [Acidobacteriota bacterium]